MKKRTRGLTLTELLSAMAIFALGGASIVALFLANAKLSAQAVNMTRAAEITRNVRSFITSSLTRPIATPTNVPLYRFDYAGASLKFRPSLLLQRENAGGNQGLSKEDVQNMAGKASENALFFTLPTETFNATAGDEDMDKSMVDLPNEGLNRSGTRLFSAGQQPEVYRLMPDALRESSVIRGFDADDRMFYSFDFSIRRSVSRASEEITGGTGVRVPLEDLFVVHLRIYRGFDFAEENGGERDNTRNLIYETSFMVAAAR